MLVDITLNPLYRNNVVQGHAKDSNIYFKSCHTDGWQQKGSGPEYKFCDYYTKNINTLLVLLDEHRIIDFSITNVDGEDEYNFTALKYY